MIETHHTNERWELCATVTQRLLNEVTRVKLICKLYSYAVTNRDPYLLPLVRKKMLDLATSRNKLKTIEPYALLYCDFPFVYEIEERIRKVN